jgi:AraC family transcriptional regulator
MTSLTPRRRVLLSSADRRIALTWYPPGHAMAAHAHDADQRSVLLAGALSEQAGRKTSELSAGVTGFKAAGVVHANDYGRDGALILAFDGPTPNRVRSRGDWAWRGGVGLDAVRTVLGAALSGAAPIADAANDLDAMLEAVPSTLKASDTPPHWLTQVKAAVDEDPASARVETLAADAGVHRVHLSRRFAAAFGTPFSLYRRRAMTAKAVRTLLHEQDGAGGAAIEAGFADQAHFTRALKAETGLTPARLAAALA